MPRPVPAPGARPLAPDVRPLPARRGRRGLIRSLLALLLLLALAAAVYIHRDWVAETWPAARPALDAIVPVVDRIAGQIVSFLRGLLDIIEAAGSPPAAA